MNDETRSGRQFQDEFNARSTQPRVPCLLIDVEADNFVVSVDFTSCGRHFRIPVDLVSEVDELSLRQCPNGTTVTLVVLTLKLNDESLEGKLLAELLHKTSVVVESRVVQIPQMPDSVPSSKCSCNAPEQTQCDSGLLPSLATSHTHGDASVLGVPGCNSCHEHWSGCINGRKFWQRECTSCWCDWTGCYAKYEVELYPDIWRRCG